MTKRDLGPLAAVLMPTSRFDESGALVEAALRFCDPQVATALVGHPAWMTVRVVTMPKVPFSRRRHAVTFDQLVFANPTMGRLESVMMMGAGAIGAWLRSKQRPRTIGLAWLDDLWQDLDLLLALKSPPKNLVIDNPHTELSDWTRPRWDRFWASGFVANLERFEIRYVNLKAHLWEALRDHEVRRVVIGLGGHELVWSSPPPTLTVPAIPLPKAKAARAKAEHSRAYLKQELAHVPRGIKIATLSE